MQYTFKTYILINIQDIYLILTKIGKKDALINLYLTLVNELRFLMNSGKKFHNNGVMHGKILSNSLSVSETRLVEKNLRRENN